MKTVETDLDNQTTVVREGEVKPKPEPEPEPEPKPEPEPELESAPEPKPEPEPELKSKSKVETVIETVSSEEVSVLDTVYGSIKDNLSGVDMDLSSIMIYTAKTMEFVETLNQNTQLDKKSIVMDTIYRFLDENTELTDTELDFIKFMLDGIIESIIKTSTKEIKINVEKR